MKSFQETKSLCEEADKQKGLGNYLEAARCYERAGETAAKAGEGMISSFMYRDAAKCYNLASDYESMKKAQLTGATGGKIVFEDLPPEGLVKELLSK